MVVVEVRQRTLWIASRSWAGGRGGQREEEDEEEEDQATDIKSNNPHLAGGEKRRKFRFQIEDIDIIFQRLPSQAQKKNGNPVFK